LKVLALVVVLVLLAPVWALGMERHLTVEEFLNPDDYSNFVLVEKSAIGLLPPETVGATYVDQAIWSDDGRYIAFNRRNYPLRWMSDAFVEKEHAPNQSLAESNAGIWDSKSGISTYLWVGKKETFVSMKWLSGAHVLLAMTRQTVAKSNPANPQDTVPEEVLTLWSADAGRGKAAALLTVSGGDAQLTTAANAPLAVVSASVQPDDKEPFFWLIGSAPIAERVQLPEGTAYYYAHWLEDGMTPCLNVDVRDKDGKHASMWYTLDVAAKALVVWDGKETPQLYEPLRTPPASFLVAVPLETPQEFEGPRLNTLWMESTQSTGKKKRLLIAADTDFYQLSPGNDMIMYRAEGALFVRRVKAFPQSGVEAAIVSAQRSQLQRQAKEVGLAIRMFCSDNEDTLPSSSDFAEKVRPYLNVLSNGSPLDGFTYTYGGGTESEIENPSETMMGYFSGPGGFAVAFADGHVKWVTSLSEVKQAP
jgi:prepilin-type processing-associated H-X9-DG protein